MGISSIVRGMDEVGNITAASLRSQFPGAAVSSGVLSAYAAFQPPAFASPQRVALFREEVMLGFGIIGSTPWHPLNLGPVLICPCRSQCHVGYHFAVVIPRSVQGSFVAARISDTSG